MKARIARRQEGCARVSNLELGRVARRYPSLGKIAVVGSLTYPTGIFSFPTRETTDAMNRSRPLGNCVELRVGRRFADTCTVRNLFVCFLIAVNCYVVASLRSALTDVIGIGNSRRPLG